MNSEMLTLAAELAEVMRLVDDDDVAAVLERFVRRAVRSIPGCDDAAIITHSNGGLEIAASATEVRPNLLEPGPVVEALAFREPRRLDDTATDQRWPAFSAQIATEGYRSCLALPLASLSDPAAVLALYSSTPDQFAEASFDLVLLLAMNAGVAFDNATLYHDSRKLIDHLRNALRSRSLIGSAQGLLMHRNGFDTDSAFAALRTASQHNNIKLRDVAARLVTAHERGELESAIVQLGLSVEEVSD
ncbi:MAG TPA: GAF and ANTAR domain-containing protein [Actinophytocola sp.]|uniref:GAF and ANTAR domain-containing protein n=1 Tax=Actinophytocola sp. TaxID=1872138 RepID=UPI002DDCBB1F|nr:GAF and ANTAR domain-containing protein [Actinophytocola sp.]HEV2780716.1 GAF and ANTAR domain-containing protein [Actinophytocola sp.]